MSSQIAASLTRLRGYFSFPEIAGQNAWLDLLRATAVLLVLVRHGERAVGAPESGLTHNLFINGWVGVDLFLVLSGYLIARSLLCRQDGSSLIHVRTYIRARVLRIVPAYFFTLFVIAAGLVPFYVVESEDMARRVIYHLLFLQDYLPADINVVFWSLGVEEKFYLLAPVLVFGLVAVRSTKLALAILLALFLLSPVAKLAQFISAASAPEYDAFFARYRSPFHLSLEPLIAGVAVAYAQSKSLISLSREAALRLLTVAGGLMAVWLTSHEFLTDITLFDATIQPIAIALLCGCMVLAATCLGASPAPGSRFWRPMSRLSYALYLVHFPLIPLCLVGAAILHAPFWLVFVAVVAPSAAALHFFVEKPFLILKDRQSGPHRSALNAAAR